jgi:UDP-N-acetylmuramoylalanine--D-glutamate ligase
MKVAILGYGEQGRSAYEYWSALGYEVTICDRNEKIEVPKTAAARLGDNHLKNLDVFDLIVRSPIVHPEKIVVANNPDILNKVTTVTNEFFRVSPSKNIIGVTGTKGKGTTTTLISMMLETAGKRVHIAGNIGLPPLDLLKENIQPEDWIVLELANFQLIDIQFSPAIAICLMVVPEHLDWHEDKEEYFIAKQQLFEYQESKDIAIYYAASPVSKRIASASHGKLVPYMEYPGAEIVNEEVVIGGQAICKTSEVKLPGRHNLQNICAALTAFWQVAQDAEAARKVIKTFAGMEHRLELVREVNGVKYYDDSFGTTPETAIVAIEAFKQPKIVILGGSDKGSSYSELAKTIKNTNVKKVILIGKMGNKIRSELEKVGFSEYEMGGVTMNQIVMQAQKFADSGDIVLLSTGCASFDMFKNYKDRADKFVKAVKLLS